MVTHFVWTSDSACNSCPLKFCGSVMRVIFWAFKMNRQDWACLRFFLIVYHTHPTTIQFWSIIRSFSSQQYLIFVISMFFHFSTDLSVAEYILMPVKIPQLSDGIQRFWKSVKHWNHKQRQNHFFWFNHREGPLICNRPHKD